MLAEICLIIGILILAAAVISSILTVKVKYEKRRYLRPFNILALGIVIASILIFIPVYKDIFSGHQFCNIKSFIMSVHNTIRLFIVDGDFDIINNFTSTLPLSIAGVYSIYASIIFVITPFFTFGFVLTFFQGVLAYERFVMGFFKDVYVFSELNTESLSLAQSLKENDQKRLIVFTDVYVKDENTYELQEKASQLNAICMKKDILEINFNRHSRNKEIKFFIIGDDDKENINHMIKLAEKYGDKKKTWLYQFTDNIETHLSLSMICTKEMKVRCVRQEQALINRILYEDGHRLFENAVRVNDKEKIISIVIVGMGKFGINMLKSLAWFGQMDGYKIQLDVFDKDSLAEDRFKGLCPELMSDKRNGISEEGEAEYRINIHSGVFTDTKEFADEIMRLPYISYAFVALGTDNENIKAALNLRMIFERKKLKPVIQAVVFDSNVKKILTGIKNFRGESYNIEFVGDIESSYTEEVILNSELEREALKRHLLWGEEEEFWRYEYNYCSSIASAIHRKAKEVCNIPGTGKTAEEMTEEEKDIFRMLEHKRWNAYMRSEGYIYSGSLEKQSRNDIGKMHNNLVSYHLLSAEDKRKDV